MFVYSFANKTSVASEWYICNILIQADAHFSSLVNDTKESQMTGGFLKWLNKYFLQGLLMKSSYERISL